METDISQSICRCPWPAKHQLAIHYHDKEWGTPVHDDSKHFEYIVLDAFQAGLNWNTILNKRENFRTAFHQFDFHQIANYSEKKIQELLQDTSIIRNKQKILGTIQNAKAFIQIRDEFGTFDSYIWKFVNGKPLINHYVNANEVPARTDVSDVMSRELKNKGFKFVGTTICYAYMQAAGLVNDHLISCFRYSELIS